MRVFIRLIAILFLLTGCTQPAYQAPYTDFPEGWKTTQDGVSACPDNIEFWWEIFNDKRLNELEQDALAYNQDIFIAVTNVWEARAQARYYGADLYPKINLHGLYDNRMMLMRNPVPIPTPLPGPFPCPCPSTPIPKLFRFHQQTYQLSLDMNYELDLWGRIRLGYCASIANAQSQEYNYQSALLSVTAEVAQHYFLLRGYDAEIEVLNRTVQLRKDALRINQDRFKGGLVNQAEVSRAIVELSSVEADREEVIRLRELEENVLATLTGRAPVDLLVCKDPIKGVPPVIPAGMPSTLLLRRPDVIAAERQVAAAYARLGQARASLFPAITLTGALGFLSPDFKHFLSWESRFWAIGAELLQTVFDGGAKEAQIDQNLAVNARTIAQYRQTILTALREVEDSLTSLKFQLEEAQTLNKLVQAAKQTSDLVKERYISGLVNYLEVVDADRSLLEGERRAVQVETQRFISTVQLLKAIGGCW
jgi:multidrug efflux system outer membrane protein